MFRVVGCLVLAVVSAAVLSACTSAADIPDSGPLPVHPRPEAGMDALLEGVLRTDDGCVRVEHEGGTAVPTFPAGDASWSGNTLTWRGDDYTDGDAIALGGGFMGTASAPSADGYMPEACVGLEVFVVSPY
ncbi:hypothetical protein ACFC1W_04580 [Microbacterium sp. NPDC056003]|jgi:hypothetical protein|uniref:hypothetical protein n=1 Tax=Microbacterium sp. NPDC056003 TaxID=3345676 RepID=UPI0035E21B47